MRPILVAVVLAGSVLTPVAAQQRPAPVAAHRFVPPAAAALAAGHVRPPALFAVVFGADAVAHAAAPAPVAVENVPIPFVLPRVSRRPQDPADSVWRAARDALNRGNYTRAVSLYRQIRTNSRYARSEYRAAAYYWEAYARHRIRSDDELRNALEVLALLKRNHPRYEGMAEANRLEATIKGALAQGGNANEAQTVRQNVQTLVQQNQACDETQMYALEALMHMPAAEAVPLLKRVMQRRDCQKLREKAVFILSQKRSPEVEQILLDAVRGDPSPEVRKQAVFWLSQVNSERAVDALDDIIRNSRDRELLEAALFALSQHRSTRATALLRELVSRPNIPVEVRKHAIFSLSQRRDAAVAPLLRSLYAQTTDRETKEAILFALTQRRDPQNAEFLFEIAMNEREDVEMRKKALFFAGQQRTLPVNRLGQLYRTMPHVEMRKQILFTLSQSRNADAVTQLIEIVRSERDPELKKQALFWLGQSRDPRAVRAIAEIIGG
jgi:HEAT repeat protein